VAAAARNGFKLIVKHSRDKSKEFGTIVRFCCSRNRLCNSDKLEQLRNVIDDGGVLLPGIVHQPLKKQTRGNNCKKPESRKTTSELAADEKDRCPFTLSIGLSGEKWYVVRRTRMVQQHGSLRMHFGHPQVDPNHIPSSVKAITEKEIEDIKFNTDLHFTTAQQALIMSKEGKLYLPRQLQWLSTKAGKMVLNTGTDDASSADAIIKYFESQEDISWITLMDHRGEKSGLIETRNKGRPKGSKSKANQTVQEVADIALKKKFDGEQLRKDLKISSNQSILLAICWIHDSERRLAELFPEVFYMDVTHSTNNEKRGLFLVAGKDSMGRGYTASRIFLPNERKWVFGWIFGYALPFLLGKAVLRRNCVTITDGDDNMYNSLMEHAGVNGLWEGTHHVLCQWHLFNLGWNHKVKPYISDRDERIKDVAKITANWIKTWFNEIETFEEFDESYARLQSWLDTVIPNTVEAIRNFITEKLLVHRVRFLRCYRIKVQGFDELANSNAESQNSSIKRGPMKIQPNMSMQLSSKIMTDKHSMIQNYHAVTDASKLNATCLWSSSKTSFELTKLAEGVVCQEFERRISFSMAQGKTLSVTVMLSLPLTFITCHFTPKCCHSIIS